MTNKKFEDMRIIMEPKRVIRRRELFEKKEEFHRKQAKLPFEEKIKILFNLQKIANSIKKYKK